MSILEDFVANHQSLPADVLRNLELIRLLDCKLKANEVEVADLTGLYFAKHDNATYLHVKRLHESMRLLAEEKLAIAKQLTDTLAAASQRLSASIKILECQVRAPLDKDQPQKKKSEIKVGDDIGTLDYLHDFPIFDHDKPMCVCGKGSYGDMVKCDGLNCLIEWFHFKCVGILSQPDGTWLCPDCSSRVA